MMRLVLLGLLLALAIPATGQPPAPGAPPRDFAELDRLVQARCVKIYGAGGFKQLEAYQSGLLVSAEGHIATVSSLVLDRDQATVILSDGRKYTATLVGSDPVAEIALLKIDAEGDELPYFDLGTPTPVVEGQRVLAYSNLYNVATGDEPVSVLQGSVAIIAPLTARRGAFSTRYRGDVIVLDASTNNPGAAGGVLVDLAGRPLGMLGKEVRSELTDTWLNYAIPLAKVAESIEQIRSGQVPAAATAMDDLPEHPATLAGLGFRLVPDVLPRTPPYIDSVVSHSPAGEKGLRPDDLVVAVEGVVTASCQEVLRALRRLPADKPVTLSVLRRDRLVELVLEPSVTRQETTP
jgi:S1-C subfamily serine protease